MAALIKDKLGLESDLVEGGRGEFTVWVNDERVAQKTKNGFPTEEEILATVQRVLK